MIKQLLHLYSLAKNNEVTYVQVGAFDGVTGDLIYPFIRASQWTGVRVEPIPEYFANLEELHRDDPRTVCVNKAISNEAGSKILYSVAKSNDNPSFAEQLSSFSKEIILKHADKIPNLSEKIIETIVPCITLRELVRQYSIQPLNLVYIDTEGYDDKIINQIDFENNQPEIVIFENKHLGSEALMNLLLKFHQLDYSVCRDGQDTLAMSIPVLSLLLKQNSKSSFIGIPRRLLKSLLNRLS